MSEAHNTIEQSLDALVKEWTQRHPAPDPDVAKWILPDLSCRFIQALSCILPVPCHAVEFGSGRSTHALRTVCASVTSLEDSQEWLEKTEIQEGGIKQRQNDYMQVIPLSRCWLGTRPIESFDLSNHQEALDRLQKASLVLVDSPPNPAKREHTLVAALQHAPVGSVIVADDLDVGTVERFAFRLAQQNTKLFTFWQLPFDHLLGVYYKHHSGQVDSRATLREFAGAWRRA